MGSVQAAFPNPLFRRSVVFPGGGAAIVLLGKDRSLVLSPRAMLSHEPIEWPDEEEVLVQEAHFARG
jgi:hypothetical protein